MDAERQWFDNSLSLVGGLIKNTIQMIIMNCLSLFSCALGWILC